MTREEAIKRFEALLLHVDTDSVMGIETTEAINMAIKALDQPERAHGHWIHKGCGSFECDQCGKLVSINAYIAEKASDRFKFCPSCGFDMREGAEQN